jgi:hypothetical protein
MKMLLYDKESKSVKLMENQEMIIHSQILTAKSTQTNPSNPRKKQLNIINLLGSKKYLPLHPDNEPKDVCDVCLDQEKVTHQNLFALGLICLGLCWMKEPLELGIYSKGGYIFEKIYKRISQIKNKYPLINKILIYFINNKNPIKKYGYLDILSEIYSRKKSMSK